MNGDARRGFTLIELMVVMAVLALLAMLVSPRYFKSVEQARETALRTNLQETRRAIDQYFTDRGQYPSSLQDLVDERYLRSLPIDPMTDRADTWTLVAPRNGQRGNVYDLRSGAAGQASDGTAYATW